MAFGPNLIHRQTFIRPHRVLKYMFYFVHDAHFLLFLPYVVMIGPISSIATPPSRAVPLTPCAWLCGLARLLDQILIDSYAAITGSEPTRQSGLASFSKVSQPCETSWPF